MRRFLAILSGGLPIWVLVGALAAFLYPEAFRWTELAPRTLLGGTVPADSPASPLDLPGQPLAMWAFALTMFAVGTVIEPSSFRSLLRRPLAVLLGLLTQFSVMPALAWLTATLGGFHPDVALGFIIVGCAPGAMTSNVLTYLARGDTAYSVTLTTIASILSVFLTPLLVLLLAGEQLGMSVEKFWLQLWTILWTVAGPLLLGIGLRLAAPAGRRAYRTASPGIAVFAIVVICCFVIQKTSEHLTAATVGIFAGVAVVNALGFVLGGQLAKLYRLDRPRRVTLAIEIGMQNAGIGVVLATSTFANRSRVAIPSALFTIWCILTAAALIEILARVSPETAGRGQRRRLQRRCTSRTGESDRSALCAEERGSPEAPR